MNRKQLSRKQNSSGKGNSPPADPAATVLPTVWMLTVGVTALAEIASAIGAAIAARTDNTATALATVAAMYTAAVVSLFALALTVVVARTMRPAPPKALIGTAIAVGLVPWIVLVVQLAT